MGRLVRLAFDRVTNQLMGFGSCRTFPPAGSRSAAATESASRHRALMSLNFSVTGMSQASGAWLRSMAS